MPEKRKQNSNAMPKGKGHGKRSRNHRTEPKQPRTYHCMLLFLVIFVLSFPSPEKNPLTAAAGFAPDK